MSPDVAAPNRAIRVGIDVGGTFTDAVALDASTLDLLGQAKVLTTHAHPDGVAHGIIDALRQVLRSTGREPGDVVFLAHGTTQATNALLEGDVATVGLVGLGRGLEGWRTRSMASMRKLALTDDKRMPVIYKHAKHLGDVSDAVGTAQDEGAEVIVGVEAFSVDDPAGELEVVASAKRAGLPATGTHMICKLYGLSKRTRTAVVNASILPRMLATSALVKSSITAANVTAPLMIMRCDGGVMSLDEMRDRPLLTILSGPAAGAAGALLSERVSEGIFLETGGTSTDISAIRDGKVAVAYAMVGGYETYLKALDVRTVAIGGGSMVRIKGDHVSDVGPRSAHIVGLGYACFTEPERLRGAALSSVQPLAGDPSDYAIIETEHGKFAITVTCAANALGLVPEGDHAYANPAAARMALQPVADRLGTTVDGAARAILNRAVARIRPVVESLTAEYELDQDSLLLVGGGGGAATVTPYLGSEMKTEYRIATHNAVISPIGVAMAMMRETVERVIPQPTQADLLAIRAEAERAVLRQGAAPATVEVDVTVDPQRNIVVANASGAADIRIRNQQEADSSEARSAAAKVLRVDPSALIEEAATDYYRVFTAATTRTGLLGRLRATRCPTAAVTTDGIVTFHARDAVVCQAKTAEIRTEIDRLLDELTSYGDSGAMIPAIRLLVGSQIVDLSGLPHADQVQALANTELARRPDDELAILIAQERR